MDSNSNNFGNSDFGDLNDCDFAGLGDDFFSFGESNNNNEDNYEKDFSFSAFDFADKQPVQPVNKTESNKKTLWNDNFNSVSKSPNENQLWMTSFENSEQNPTSERYQDDMIFSNAKSSQVSFIPKNKRSNTAPVTLKKNTTKQVYFEVGQNSHEVYLPDVTEEDKEFIELCKNKSFLVNPHQIGFIPQEYFLNQYYSFGDLVIHYFHKKNNPNCRFTHKLYNAIKLGEAFPDYLKFIGVSWLTRDVIHVSKNRFARLLGIKTVDGSLFHRQGNFKSLGFRELLNNEIVQEIGSAKLESMNCDIDKLLKHEQGIFVKDGDVQQILEMCKWKSCKTRI